MRIRRQTENGKESVSIHNILRNPHSRNPLKNKVFISLLLPLLVTDTGSCGTLPAGRENLARIAAHTLKKPARMPTFSIERRTSGGGRDYGIGGQDDAPGG